LAGDLGVPAGGGRLQLQAKLPPGLQQVAPGPGGVAPHRLAGLQAVGAGADPGHFPVSGVDAFQQVTRQQPAGYLVGVRVRPPSDHRTTSGRKTYTPSTSAGFWATTVS